MAAYEFKPHTENSFLVELADGRPVGVVTIGEDEKSWYGEFLCVREGGYDSTVLYATRAAAAEKVVDLWNAGRSEEFGPF